MRPASKVDVLLPEAIHPSTRARLESLFELHLLNEASDPEELLGRVGPRIRAVARGGQAAIDRRLMERLPALEIVAVFGVGYDGIDLAYARERGIVVTNTPDVLSEEVADLTIGLLIMTLRELARAERYVRAGDWARLGKFPPTRGSLRGRKAGILGLGRIGRAIARRLEAMGVPVAYHNRRRVPDAPYEYVASAVELAAAVDTLIAVLPGGAATDELVDAAVLRALGPEGVFVNVGRGSTVDEDALIAALRDGTIMAAGLDVFRNEPHVDPRFLGLDNVVLLPHVGSASLPTHDAMGELLVANLRSWFETGEPLTPVPETPWPVADRS
ncbi:MAG TPA: 2-hydroxyacid dehydrogenase [Trueperaceae bacterium]|jgi:lactate dehydrogenase-like 2-hydroxyacid dehydrogenase